MFCAKCGNEIEADAKFCGKCGNGAEGSSTVVTQSGVPKQVSKTKQITTGITTILAFVVAFAGVRFLMSESFGGTPTKEEIIQASVQEVRDTTVFPMELDEVTVWNGITGTSNALRYQYTLHDIDTTQISNYALKNLVVPAVCGSADTKKILDADINMEYAYSVRGSAQTYFVSVSKVDCI